MPLYLSGGGSGKKSEDIDRLFSKNVDKSKPILYIPIAIDNIKHPYPECLKWIKNNFRPYGLEKFIMCTEENAREFVNSNPTDFAGIYIGGGNTFYLLKTLKDTGLFDFLIKAYRQDMHIAGGSAGAIIFGKSIASAYSEDKNDVKIKDISGLDLLNGFDISAHYIDTKDKVIYDLIKKYRMKYIIAIPEDSALYIHKKVENIGKSPIIIISGNSRKIIPAGSKIDLK